MLALTEVTQHDVLVMEEQESWIERLQEALAVAKERRQFPVINNELGISGDRLSKFLRKGYMGAESLKALEGWLIRNRYMDENVANSSPNKDARKPPSDLLAAELRALADILESPDIDKEIKGERFVSAVRGWHNAVEKYARLLQEKKN